MLASNMRLYERPAMSDARQATCLSGRLGLQLWAKLLSQDAAWPVGEERHRTHLGPIDDTLGWRLQVNQAQGFRGSCEDSPQGHDALTLDRKRSDSGAVDIAFQNKGQHGPWEGFARRLSSLATTGFTARRPPGVQMFH